jgi:hypothetical protein
MEYAPHARCDSSPTCSAKFISPIHSTSSTMVASGEL